MTKNLLTYAINKFGELVYVDDVAKGLECECICPCCKAKLVAKNGGIKKIHHFAHASEIECEGAYESMLHLLAKEKIKKAFLENDEFNMQFVYRSYCQKYENCKLIKYGKCYKSFTKKFNLKEYYDSCEPEISYDNIRRRSDLKIFSSKYPKRYPIYIEFFVTHACDEEKLHHGEKIIEIKIESEEDIEKIVAEGFIQNDELPYREYEEYYEPQYSKISFYGFKSKDNLASIQKEVHFSRFTLYPSGKSIFKYDSAMCTHIVKASKVSLLEICFHTSDTFGLFDTFKYQGFKRYGIKNCHICINYVDRYSGCGKICKKYKSLGATSIDNWDTARAKDCEYFILNAVEMKDALLKYDSIPTEQKTEFV